MALFILTVIILLNSFNCALSFEDDDTADELEITPSKFIGQRYFGVYQVENTLNLSCILKNETEADNIVLDWVFPFGETDRANLTVSHVSSSLLNLVIKNVTENDSGEYRCTAVKIGGLWYSEKSIIINVKNKKGECSEMMFQCSCGMCIHKRYTCDGYKDCHHGEDEMPSHCGPGNPCDHKLKCPDGRCIPYSWCCDLFKEENCTTKLRHDCCFPLERLTHDMDSDIGFQYNHRKFYDWSFLQTTVYIVIGCTLAFTGLFIVIIIVIVTCRMHLRRSVITRCPAAYPRSVHGARQTSENYIPFYDFNVYLNRPNTNHLMNHPLSVTYNMGNGVRFVGRQLEPPPYSEVIRSPPIEGPPPPYVSTENLSYPRRETVEGKENADDSESETLLGPQRQISVISSNVIDVVERPTLVDREEDSRPRGKLVNADGRSLEFIVLKDQCPDCTNSDINESPKNEALVLNNDNSESESSESPRRNV